MIPTHLEFRPLELAWYNTPIVNNGDKRCLVKAGLSPDTNPKQIAPEAPTHA